MSSKTSEYTKLITEPLVHESPTKPLKTTTKKKRSILKRCCYIFLIVIGVLALFAAIAGAKAYYWMKRHVVHWTVESPVPLPVVNDMSKDEVDLIGDRAHLFFDSLKANIADVPDFILSKHELNGIFGTCDVLRGNAYVNRIEDDSFSMDVSLPADKLPGGKGRFFVARIDIVIDEEDRSMVMTKIQTAAQSNPMLYGEFHVFRDAATSKLGVNLLSGQFMEWEAPQDFIDEQQNLVEDLYADDDNKDVARAIANVDTVELQHNEITVVAALHHQHSDALEEASYGVSSSSASWKWDGGARLLREMVL